MPSAPFFQAGPSSAVLPILAATASFPPSPLWAGSFFSWSSCRRRRSQLPLFQPVVAFQGRAGLQADQPAPAVDDQFRAILYFPQLLRRQRHGGDSERARQDDGMRGRAHVGEDQAAQAAAVQAQQFGRSQGGGRDHAGLAQNLPGAGGGAAVQLFAQLPGQVMHVLRPFPQVGAGRTPQHAGKMGRGLADGRSRGLALADDPVADALLEPGIAEHAQVRSHDAGGVGILERCRFFAQLRLQFPAAFPKQRQLLFGVPFAGGKAARQCPGSLPGQRPPPADSRRQGPARQDAGGAVMENGRQPELSVAGRQRRRQMVVGMGQDPLQERAQGPRRGLFVGAADLQAAGIAAGRAAGHQRQDAAGVGAGPAAVVAPEDGGGERLAGLLQHAGRPGMQAVGQREGESDLPHGPVGGFIWPGGRTGRRDP